MSTATTDKPIYDVNDLTLAQVIDLAEGRALLRNPRHNPHNPDDRPAALNLTLTEEDRRIFDTARDRNYLEIVQRDHWSEVEQQIVLHVPLEELWKAYCHVKGERRPIAVLTLDRPNVSPALRHHVLTINIRHMGLRVPYGVILNRLTPYLEPFVNHRRDYNDTGIADVVFRIRDSKLDELRGFMPALVDMVVQDLAVAREEEPTP
jgi:hypothetical protein